MFLINFAAFFENSLLHGEFHKTGIPFAYIDVRSFIISVSIYFSVYTLLLYFFILNLAWDFRNTLLLFFFCFDSAFFLCEDMFNKKDHKVYKHLPYMPALKFQVDMRLC